MESMVDIIYKVSNVLFFPVILSLFFLMAYSIIFFGAFVREFIERKKSQKIWAEIYNKFLSCNNIEELKTLFFDKKYLRGYIGQFSFLGRNMKDNFLYLDKLLTDLEIKISGKLSSLSFLIRISPMLGLMGTLIPLGPVLMGLESGDIKKMSQNLIIAFGTTVLGLAISIVFYGISTVRRTWYAYDLSDIEFIINFLYENRDTTETLPDLILEKQEFVNEK